MYTKNKNTMVIIVCIIALLFATALHTLRLAVKTTTAAETVRSANASPHYDLPRTIWAYWDDPNPPKFIEDNISEWHSNLHGWTITLLNRDSFKVPEWVAKSGLGVQHQSDWIRLYLLKTYGGVWMDAGIITNASNSLQALEELRNQSIAIQSQWTGYALDKKHENWFIMAPHMSPFVIKWFDEYERAIRMGFDVYKAELKKEGVDVSDIYHSEEDTYLTQHACLRAVLTRRPNTPPMIVRDAYESMFKIHGECNWDKECIQRRIKTTDVSGIPFIKLRGNDR